MSESTTYKMLVSCVLKQGALYRLEWSSSQYELTKIFDGNCRGMARHENQFIVANSKELLILNEQFQVVHKKRLGTQMSYHGIGIYNNNAYIVETEMNSIGIYSLPDLFRVGEIPFPPTGQDVFHINDLCIVGDTMFLSMFTNEGLWRDSPATSGIILSYDLINNAVEKVLISNLYKPHSVISHEGELYYCNSGHMEVRKGEEMITTAPGFTRGLAVKDNYMFVGVSRSRHLASSLSNDTACGIYVYDQETNQSHFIPLPSTEVYGVLIYD